MERTPPRLYLFFGEDDFSMAEAVAGLRARLGDPATGDLNSRSFQASSLDFEDLGAASRSLPFLSPRRLVVIEGAEDLPRRPDWAEQLERLLQASPPTTALVLLEQFDFSDAARQARRSGKRDLRPEDLYARASHIGRWAADHSEDVLLRAFPQPHGTDFLQWLKKRAALLGASLDDAAAEALAEAVQDEPRVAEQELRKLMDFTGGSRPIRMDDVVRLTPYRGQADVFEMADAIGLREGRRAMGLLHQLLEQEDPHYVFAMLIRQFRLLVLAQAHAARGGEPPALLARLPRFVLAKVTSQARNFRLEDLESIYHRLLEVDLADKTSQIDLAIGLETLVAEWTA
jgi:DNA polymerase-3 subunit delta